jgi:hypothetical protein
MLMANRWNYVRIVLNGAAGTVQLFVNGQTADVQAVAGFNAMGSAAYTSAGDPLYLFGFPSHQSVVTIAYAGGASLLTTTFLGTCGMMREFRVQNVVSAVATIPRELSPDSANTWNLLHLAEGSGWIIADTSANVGSAGNAVPHLDEMIPIAEGLEESRGASYDHVVYRNRMIVTNGRSHPQEIRFRRFSHPVGPFRVRRLGMQPPAANDIRPSGQFQGGVTYPVGVYQVWMAFVDEDGLESDATMMGVALTAGAAFANLYVAGLPRSTDPQVKSRRFWVSASGGGAALENIDLFDNETRDIQLLPSVGGNAVDEPGLKFPAPRAKNITVGEGSLWLANLPDDSSGQNKVAVSSGLEIAHWPTDRQAILSSMDGNPITALTVQFGRIYVNKRDSIWQVSLAGVIGPASLPINSSIGLGGGVAAYEGRARLRRQRRGLPRARARGRLP